MWEKHLIERIEKTTSSKETYDVKKATSFDETYDMKEVTSSEETYDVKKATSFDETSEVKNGKKEVTSETAYCISLKERRYFFCRKSFFTQNTKYLRGKKKGNI